MPLYAYQCYECGKIQEVIRSVKNRDKSIALTIVCVIQKE